MRTPATLVALFLVGCPGSSGSNGDGDDETSSGDEGILSLDDAATEEGTATEADSTAGTADESSTSELNCGEVDFTLQAVPPNVMLVLDKSGSMIVNEWDHDADPGTPEITRWNSLYNVVETVVGGFDTQINFGANLFPSLDAVSELSEQACLVDPVPAVEVGAGTGEAILAAIPDPLSDDIEGATPATAGVGVGRTHLETLDPRVPRFIVLVTDGAANCSADASTEDCPGVGCDLMENYDTNLPIAVAAAFEAGIPTFVVGIDIVDELLGEGDDGAPEANTHTELNAVAVAGGRPQDGNDKFFNAQNELDLQAALAEIAGQVVSCVVPLEPPPEHPNFVEVEIGGQSFDRVEDCAAGDGWRYVNPEGPYDAIELCGAACDALTMQGDLDATYGCPPAG
jgi:hypothetical protein